MDFWSWSLFSWFLLLSTAGLMYSHVRTWQRVRQRAEQLAPKELEYRRRQFRRRVQATTMLALLAVAVLAGYWVRPPRVRPPVFFAYWGGVLLVVFWVAALAMADIFSTKHYFSGVRHRYWIEEVKLQAELRRLQAIQGNGKTQRDLKGKGPAAERPDEDGSKDD